MKKIITIGAVILMTTIVFAQAPQKMSYQAVIRNNSNTLVINTQVGMQISILQGAANGTAVYVETQTPASNANGLVSLEVGAGTIVSGTFATINWANGPYFIKTETDPTGGTNYTITGTSQFLSVPYALHAKTAETLIGNITENDPIFGASVAAGITAADIAQWNIDNDSTNEIQQLSVSPIGDTLHLQNGGFVIIPGISAANAPFPQYPAGSVFCASGPTVIVDVTNPATGRIWMDRNLGATQVATSSTDTNSYGDLYQWGRRSDGHQCRNSATTSTLSSIDQPAHGNFIIAPYVPFDWRSPQNNNLWQGANGLNNPCPSGYRLPTDTELNAERLSWSSDDAQGAFASPLKLPMAGFRNNTNALLNSLGSSGNYRSSVVAANIFNQDYYSYYLDLGNGGASLSIITRAYGFSVRCIKDVSSPQGSINNLDCGTATNIGTLTSATAASGVSSIVPYTGGNGGMHNGQIVASTGVTGLTATLSTGIFANGAGSLTYNITGTPNGAGTASFALNIGGQSCILTFLVSAAQPQYPAGSVFCASGATAVVDVTNPATGRIWMDRNLGATQVATSSTDTNSYGDLYQWGRRSDGHQCRTSPTTSILSSVDQPTHGDFILAPNSPYDWRSPQNTNLWQGVNGVNNPCPSGYRLPTEAELNAERLSWSSNNAAGALGTPLKLPLAGGRNNNLGSSVYVGTNGFYYSSSVSNTASFDLSFNSSSANVDPNGRAAGRSVRCIKD